MTEPTAVAALAGVLADRSRCAMVMALLDGAAWTVTELAAAAGVSLSTASEHVSTLVGAGIATEERQGRCRYVTLTGADVAQAIEAFSTLAQPEPARSLRTASRRERLARARTCYDHLAGRLGVAVFDAMAQRRLVRPGSGVTTAGERWFVGLDIDLAALREARRPVFRECLDWTERRPHLAGSVGAALCDRFVERQWVRRPDRTRRLEVTATGQRALTELLGIEPAGLQV